MVAVVKPNKLRICIDPRDLNEAIRREHFPMTTIEEVVADMPQASIQNSAIHTESISFLFLINNSFLAAQLVSVSV